ncbi:MAG: acetate--CoA ligase family protein [Acidobacteria bacterium]|nr:acetate--CoA ligase family protein [Acidobacteriota bacterium]
MPTLRSNGYLRPPPDQRFFRPRGIAVIGASDDPAKVAWRPVHLLKAYGYTGSIYPVNPRHKELLGLRCVSSVDNLPEDTVDLALILVGAESVPGVLEACGRKRIPYAVVVAAGFAEAGQVEAQARLRAICEEYGLRLLGPNCVGMMVPAHGVMATFSTVALRQIGNGGIPSGGLVLLTQSGAVGNALLQSCLAEGLGLRVWVNTGNEADLDALDVLDAVVDDAETSAILIFAEGFVRGERLVALGLRASRRGIPVVVVKAGQSTAGRSASALHTGKLIGRPEVFHAVAQESGVIIADSLRTAIQCLRLSPGPRSEGELGVMTVSGGVGVLIADRAVQLDLPLAALTSATREILQRVLPPYLPVRNPLDVALLGDNARYRECGQAILKDPGIGALLIVLSSLAYDYTTVEDVLRDLGKCAASAGKTIAITYLSPDDRLPPAVEVRLREAGLSAFATPEDALAALRVRLAPIPSTAMRKPLPARQPGTSPSPLSLLTRYGIPIPQAIEVSTPTEAISAAASIGYPVALKGLVPRLVHKTEAGAVRLWLENDDAVRDATAEMRARIGPSLQGFRVEAMVDAPLELLLGIAVDEEFGPVLAIGAGGTFAELWQDIAYHTLPVAPQDVDVMLNHLRLGPALRGFRGLHLDRAAVIDAVMRLADIYAQERWVQEIEINPLAVLPEGQGVYALDVVATSVVT